MRSLLFALLLVTVSACGTTPTAPIVLPAVTMDASAVTSPVALRIGQTLDVRAMPGVWQVDYSSTLERVAMWQWKGRSAGALDMRFAQTCDGCGNTVLYVVTVVVH